VRNSRFNQNNHDVPVKRSSTGARKIIAIDDDPGIQDIFKIIFEREGYVVEIKGDGEDIFWNRFTPPDVFLIDKQLSGTSGLDICRYLKARPATKDIPVIMISASPDIGPASKEAGADDYIEKPFEIDHLLRIVDHYSAKENGEPR